MILIQTKFINYYRLTNNMFVLEMFIKDKEFTFLKLYLLGKNNLNTDLSSLTGKEFYVYM